MRRHPFYAITALSLMLVTSFDALFQELESEKGFSLALSCDHARFLIDVYDRDGR